MDLKEHIISKVITVLSPEVDCEQLETIRNCLTSFLQEYDLVPKRELPSTDVLNTNFILQQFLVTKKMSGCSENTLETYNYHIANFLLQMNIPITEITTNNIRFYLTQLGMHTSNSYVDDARRIINTFFVFLEEEDYVIKNPCRKIKRIKFNKTMEMPYTDIEVELIRNACITPREKALVDFLFSTGARREEITKIKLEDINFLERSVLIHGKGGKDRMVYFSARCELHLKEYLEDRNNNSEHLFCSLKAPYNGIGKEGLHCIVKKIGERAGVSNVHLHRFRKWFGTYMVNRGVPIQDLKEMMGHSKLDTTNNYYVYANMERIKYNHKNNAA